MEFLQCLVYGAVGGLIVLWLYVFIARTRT